MLEKVIALDKELLIFLNGLGSLQYDGFWLFITKQVNWIPFFLIVFYFLQQKIGWKNLGIVILFIAVLLLFCDQTANLFKNGFKRLRPCNDPTLNTIIRVVKDSYSFSFYSGHATSSLASMTFLFMILRKYYKYAFLVFIFPIIFAYSRIYLGLHFPLDILAGYLAGLFYSILFYKIYKAFQRKYPQFQV